MKGIRIIALLAALLTQRGYDTPEQAKRFLSGGIEQLENPFLLPDMDAAVGRIRQAIQRTEKTAVYGDYDVDGITSSCLLTGYLRWCIKL